jgi:hypothetical protein
MTRTLSRGDVAIEVLSRGGITFTDFKPRGIVGHTSNIAKVLGCDESQTDELLIGAEMLEDDHHFEVDRHITPSPQKHGSKGEPLPEESILVTIRPV